MSDMAWQKIKDAGAHVSLAVPIEMNMRHGMPPILKTLSLGIEPSLCTDVEVTLTADFFTQMRSTMNLQRALVNQMILDSQPTTVNPYPPPPPGTPKLLTSRDVLRFATIQRRARTCGSTARPARSRPARRPTSSSSTPTGINVAPLNHVPGAVVSLMERTNVETVIVAGKVRKWKGRLLDVDLPRLRSQLEDSRDYIFARRASSRTSGGVGDLLDRKLERRGVRLRRLVEAGELAHELQRGGVDLVLRRGWLEIEQRLDVAAHLIQLLCVRCGKYSRPHRIINR